MAAAKVEIIYEAEATSLKATVNEVNKANSEVVKDAQVSAQKVSDSFKEAGNNIANAFANQKIKTGLDNLNKELKQTSSVVIKSAQDVSKFEDRLRELSIAGQRNTEEFNDIAKAIGEYKSAIVAADRAVDLYAKSTDAATGRIGELEDKLYDLALAGQSNTQEFKDLVREVANVKRAIVETDKQVDSFVERSRGFGTVVQNIELVGNAFQAVEGAAALFGDENEELQKTLVKLEAITAITSGIEQARLILIDQTAQKTGIAAVAQRAYGLAVGQSTGFLKIFRIALLATGVGALALGLVALINNFEKVKKALENSIPGFKTVSNAIGDVVDKIKEWVGASGDAERAGAAFDAAAKKQNAATKAIVDGYERRIAVEQAAGRNTTALEIEREEAVIAANKKILKDYQLASTEIIKLNQEQKQAAIETAQAAKDAVDESENNIKVIRATAAKEAADKAKENAEAIAKAQKETFTNLLIETAQLQKDFDKQQADERKKNEAKLQVELADLADTSLETQLDTRLAFLRRLEIEEGTSLDRRINIIELEAQKRQDNIRNTVDDTSKANALIKLDEAQTQEAIRAERKKSTEEAINQAIEIASASADALGSILKFQSQLTENRIAEIQSSSEKELEAINSSLESEVTKANKREALEKRTQSKIAAEKQKQARQEKALNIFRATIDTAASIVKTGAQLGYPAALPFQILAGIIGAANIAAIAAQPLPKFKKGGMVGGRSHEAGGTLIEAERGEYVVNKNSVMRNRRELDAINTSSAAFKRLIDERYVRPAILSYAMNNKRDGITVNASLNSKAMEKELKGLRKDMRNKNTIVNINGSDSRYSWQ
jgi:hypothetical protein